MAARANQGSGAGGVLLLVFLVALGFFFGPSVPEDVEAYTETPTVTASPAETPGSDDEAAASDPAPAPDFDAAVVRAALDGLAIKGHAPGTGFSRDQFGPAWPTNERGCDARNETLARDLDDVVFRPGSNDCVVLSGTLNCPYSGQAINFVRGRETSNAVHIGHRVSLSDAWRTGAQQWDQEKREQFANDPINLVAVDGPTNAAKSDSSAASWMPPNKAYRCQFVAAQVQVKAAFCLWVTQAEHDAISNVLDRC